MKLHAVFWKILDPNQKPFSDENSGRLELAEKIASRDNPLTARVFVNRVWGELMGSYLVNTPSDFGMQGDLPSHPDLLDWLANDFIQSGWSLKHLVRRIVTSQTYCQESRVVEAMSTIDPVNRFYHRANAKRMSIEQIRDSMLAVSGNLDRQLKGHPEPLWGDDATHRRSIYGIVNRINTDPTLRAFDFPTPTATAARRTENIVPQQSLFALNSKFVIERSHALAESLNCDEHIAPEDRIEKLFRRIYLRSANQMEIKRIKTFIALMEKRKTNPYPLIAQSLLISNEFIYVD